MNIPKNIPRIKWIVTLSPALFIGLFEFVRHDFLKAISMNQGNLLVAGLASLLFFLYFRGIFSLLENLYGKLQAEQEEKAVLRERDRIARELHDSVSQAMFFMNIKVKEIEGALRQSKTPLAEVRELQEAIKLTDADIRQHIFALQKTQEHIDLTAAIQDYLADFEQQCQIKVHLHMEGDINTRLSNPTKNQLLRIFQELLCNIRKHAEADQVDVSLINDGQNLSLVIIDNGKGFAVEKLSTNQSSFGLRILADNARTIGANLKLHSLPGQGTKVDVSLDLK